MKHVIILFILIASTGSVSGQEKFRAPDRTVSEGIARCHYNDQGVINLYSPGAGVCGTGRLPDSVQSHNRKLFWHPIIGSGPETGMILGAGAFYTLKKPDPATRISFVNGSASVSLKKYGALGMSSRYFAPGERYFIEADIGYANFPVYFYGIGNNIDPDNKELYYSTTFRVQLLGYLPAAKNLFFGAGYRYGNVHRLRSEENGLLQSLGLPGSEGHYSSGLQAAILYDSRDNPLAAHHGWFVKVNSALFRKSLGSQYEYNVHSVDIRKFFHPVKGSEDVLAIQLFAMNTTGDVPFTELAFMGSPSLMRGYYSGQYRDRNLLATQVEYRYKASNWLGFVGFAGAGAVSPYPDGFTRKSVRSNYGAGVRFSVIAPAHLTLRIDYGRGKDDGNFYIGIMEAF